MKEFTEEERTEIRSHFDYFDSDGNNEMDVDEFTRLLKTIAPEASDEEAEKGFADIDENGDGHIDFDEFLDWWGMNWSVF
ncbi:MAG: hypothetical protein DHS20C11_37650 [Lysobacteraceae bacterium]|nr:MAG: hypothetical protein DHS20C11_37650 [Xanthomonadaceae bacterium]